jgi:hypothetical protein
MIKTVSLETAKALKEAGFNKNTAFYWKPVRGASRTLPLPIFRWELENYTNCDAEDYAAPTTDELLEALPKVRSLKTDNVEGDGGCLDYNLQIKFRREGDYIYVGYVSGSGIRSGGEQENKSLVEALAQMWLWLRKEGLITVRTEDRKQ